MTHVEKRATPLREFQIAVVAGGFYGATHTVSGHPLDNVKARMQLDPSYRGLGPLAAMRALWRADGARERAEVGNVTDTPPLRGHT